MNLGAFGLPAAAPPVAPLVYVVTDELLRFLPRNQALAGYLLASEPVSDTQLLDDAGNVLRLIFTLGQSSPVRIRAGCHCAKGDTSSMLHWSVYDNGTRIYPSDSLVVGLSWESSPNHNGLINLSIEGWVTLAAGTHSLDLRHNAALSTAATRFGGRFLMAEVYGGA